MDSSFTAGLISGVAATIAGFAFTLGWDMWKARRERQTRDKAAFLAIVRELEDHASVATSNISDLQTEIALLGGNQILIKPLQPFNGRVWDLLALNLPIKLLSDTDLLSKLRKLSAIVATANEAIASRQRFKDANHALSTFTSILTKTDSDLLNSVQSLSALNSSTLEAAKVYHDAI